ncbi:hypothetical protein GCM10010112_17250 [Actinoplanes lobatus]|nr:serine/threonine-protein kinase [Actinoplanes lobatus]MBB4746312.1 serine/threonine protein kinase [Actinoplanes lobatus]GGN60695.1 hypothetical protein GCM10010112_17250 [Actinoplanes lobatus]
MSIGPGRVVAGRYLLGRMLGRGGMGAVWQAHDTLLGREVALKEVGGSSLPSDPQVRRTLREAQAAARLRHPSIVTVYDVVTDEGAPWIVMELVDGRSLAETIAEQGRLTVRRTAEIGLSVLDALRAAHREGVAHRDVKPANILLEEGRVVLTDFGIAAIDDATALTATGQMVGSPAYLAPERINGQPATAAADMWSLGVTLYAAVTGRSPFQREDTQATLAAILNSRPEAPAYGGLLWPVIKGLLDKDPVRRLGADQARELLAKVVRAAEPEAPGAVRRRRWWPVRQTRREDAPDGLPGTLVAPSPTIAAPTVAEPVSDTSAAGTSAETDAETPPAPVFAVDQTTLSGSATPLPLYPEPSRGPGRLRKGRVWLSAAVVAVLLLAGGLLRVFWPGSGGEAATAGSSASPSVPPPPSAASAAVAPGTAATPVNPNLDSCLVGTWRSTSTQVVNHFEGVDAVFTGKGGTILRIHPDGRSVADYDRSAPLTAKIKGNSFVETLRGVQASRVETRGGKLYDSGFSGGPTYQMKRNGKSISIEVTNPTTSHTQPYICSDTSLTVYGDDKVSTDAYARVSRTP